MYSFEYEWASLMSAYHCNAQPISERCRRNRDDFEFEQGTRAQLFSNLLQFMPRKFMKMREDEHLEKKNR